MNWRWMQFLVELHKEVNKAVWWKIHDESYIRNDAWFPLVYINLIQPVHPKDQSWVFIGRTDVEAETPMLWPPDVKSWLIWKNPGAGKDWGWEKGMTEDEMVGWRHQLDGQGFGWTPGVGDGQGGLVCCSSWGHKESDTTEWLNSTELNHHCVIPWLTVYVEVWKNRTYFKGESFSLLI